MVASPLLTTSVRVFVAALLLAPGVVHAEPVLNGVQKISVREEGATTVVDIHGSTTPTFTVYKLERPERVVIDLANARLGGDVEPMAVNGWAVAQVTAQRLSGEEAAVVRVLVGFARPSEYHVKAVGSDVIVTVTAREARPLDTAAADAEARRKAAESAAAQAEVRRKAAEQAVVEASVAQKAGVASAADAAKRRKEAEDAVAQAEARRKAAEDAAARAEARRGAADARRKQAEAERMQAEAQTQAARTARAAEEAAVVQAETARKAAEARRAEAETALARVEDARKKAELASAAAEARRGAAEKAAERAAALAQDARASEDQVAKARAEAKRLGDERAAAEAALDARRRELAATSARAQESEAARALASQDAAAARKAAEAARAARASEDKERVEVAAARAAEEKALAAVRAQRSTEEAKLQAAEARQKQADTVAAQTVARAKAASDAERAAAEKAAADATARARAADEEARRVAAASATRIREAEQAAASAAARARAVDDQAQRAAAARMQAAEEEAQKLLAAKLQAAEKQAALVTAAKVHEADEAATRLAAAKIQAAEEAARVMAARAQANEAEAARAAAAKLKVAEAEAAKARAQAKAAEDEAARVSAQNRQADEKAQRERAEKARAAADEATARAQAKVKAAEEEVARAQARAKEVLKAAEDEGSARAAAKVKAAEEEAARTVAEAKRAREAEEAKRAEARAAVAAAPKPPPSPPPSPSPSPVTATATAAVHLKDVDYLDRPDAARVVLDLDGPAEARIVAASEKQAILELSGVTMPAKLERTLDTREFDSPVKSIASYRDPRAPGRVRVVVDLAKGPAPALNRVGNTLYVDFPRAVAKARTTVYAPPIVGGYGAATTPITAQTVGQQRSAGVHNQRIEIDVVEADIHNLMRLISQAGGVDIIVPDDVHGNVSVKLTNVPWRQAMEVILQSKGLWYKQEGNIIRVANRKDLDAEEQAERERNRARQQEERPETEVFRLNYSTATGVLRQVTPLLSPHGKAVIDDRTNSVVITDVSGNRAGIIRLLRQLDTQTPQIQIEARVVEATSNWSRQIGVQWGFTATASTAGGNPTGLVFPSSIGVAGGSTDSQTPTGGLVLQPNPNFAVNLPIAVGSGTGGSVGFTFGSLGGNFNVALRLSAAETQGMIRIISAPKVTVLNNHQAKITQGVSIPIEVVSAAGVQTQFVPADLSLTTQPHVSARDCSIVMDVEVTKNEADFTNTGARGDPSIQRKEAKTTMLVNDGETSVIGGIYTRNTGISYAKVPWLADIPILGFFFRNRRENDDRSEVLIFLTPRITNKALLTCETAVERK